jgi:hypothetical protein
LNQFRTSFDKSRFVFTGISAGISNISRCLPVYFPKQKKNPWSEPTTLFEKQNLWHNPATPVDYNMANSLYSKLTMAFIGN